MGEFLTGQVDSWLHCQTPEVLFSHTIYDEFVTASIIGGKQLFSEIKSIAIVLDSLV